MPNKITNVQHCEPQSSVILESNAPRAGIYQTLYLKPGNKIIAFSQLISAEDGRLVLNKYKLGNQHLCVKVSSSRGKFLRWKLLLLKALFQLLSNLFIFKLFLNLGVQACWSSVQIPKKKKKLCKIGSEQTRPQLRGSTGIA